MGVGTNCNSRVPKGIRKWDNQLILQLMIMPALLTLLVSSYLPMFGIVIAFKDYNVLDGLFGGKWIGFDHFGNVRGMKDSD